VSSTCLRGEANLPNMITSISKFFYGKKIPLGPGLDLHRPLALVPNGEWGYRVLAANAGPRVPSGGVTMKRRCTYRPSVIYLIVNKLLPLSLSPPPLMPLLGLCCHYTHTHTHTHTHTSFEFFLCWSSFATTLQDCAHADVGRWSWTGDAKRHILQLLVQV
jgi:hypothetical protein